MPCSYGERSCGSRFAGYPCTSGPPILDANNNVVPKRTVLCGSEVCTKTASFRDYVSVGDTANPINVAEVDIFGNEQLFGTLTVDPATSPTLTAGIVLAADSTFASRADLALGATSTGPGASLVYAKSSPGAPVNPSRGGRLDVVFYDPVGATSASGFLYISQLPPYYLNNGTGLYYEEKWGPSLAQSPLDAASPILSSAWGCLTTTVLSSQGAVVMQQFQSSNGLYYRTSDAPPTAWTKWKTVTLV
jgi:hypothetical protein